MSYYNIKNIKVDKKNNKVSADLADSSLEPLSYFHEDNLYNCSSFEETNANFMYDIITGNFHPLGNSKYYKIMMNKYLKNYYDDDKDIGRLNTYNKYKNVIDNILNDNVEKCIKLESERTLHPELYYVLLPLKVDDNIKQYGEYYTNNKGTIFCFNKNKLCICSNDYYPLYKVADEDKYIENNNFLKAKYLDNILEM